MPRPEHVADGYREIMLKPECEHPAYLPGEPRDFAAWHEWAEEKAKTHQQRRCPYCGLYAIWEPKEVVLSREQRVVLSALDDVWVYFAEVRAPVSRRRTAAILRGLVRRGLVDSRRNDVPGQGGRTEYAISEAGDRALGRLP